MEPTAGDAVGVFLEGGHALRRLAYLASRAKSILAARLRAARSVPLYLVITACIVGVPLAVWLRMYERAVTLVCGGLGVLFWRFIERRRRHEYEGRRVSYGAEAHAGAVSR